MRARTVALLLAAALVAYLVVVGHRGLLLIYDGRLPFVLLGVGVLLLPVIGAYALYREIRFGMATERLGRQLQPGDAPAGFDACRVAVEAHPENWRAWYHLAESYEAEGDRTRARSAMRRAIALTDGMNYSEVPRESGNTQNPS